MEFNMHTLASKSKCACGTLNNGMNQIENSDVIELLMCSMLPNMALLVFFH